jgi:hypothetical protein
MKKNNLSSRRKFIGGLVTGAIATGISMIPQPIQAKIKARDTSLTNLPLDHHIDQIIKNVGKMKHPVAYDMSQAISWGFIWTNVYYMTNAQTGTQGDQLGILNVIRHHGILFAFNDETIKKYKLGEHFHFNDHLTDKPTLRNPYYVPVEGAFPLPGLAGIKGLQEQGAKFCVCDMARKVNAQFVAQKMNLNKDDVYNDFVAGTLPGIEPAPSGVWALGRLAENGIAYIDASVG